MSYPTGLLKNTKTGRWHPILFRPAPLPGGGDAGFPAQRYKSLGHHTAGFSTEEEAMAHIRQHPEMDWRGPTWEWDGEDVPLMVEYFASPGQ